VSDRLDASVILAALPLGVHDFGGSALSLAVIPCLGAPLASRPYPFGEEP
jgi:hypothetical protein